MPPVGHPAVPPDLRPAAVAELRSRHDGSSSVGLLTELGGDVFEDDNLFRDRVDDALKKLGFKLSAADLKTILRAASWRVETAPPVIAKIHKPGKAVADPLHGLYSLSASGGEEYRAFLARHRVAFDERYVWD